MPEIEVGDWVILNAFEQPVVVQAVRGREISLDAPPHPDPSFWEPMVLEIRKTNGQVWRRDGD